MPTDKLTPGVFHYPPGAPDMTLEGHARRLAAARAAIRFRHPEKRPGQHGHRLWVHGAAYRAGFAKRTRALHLLVTQMRALAQAGHTGDLK